MRSAGDGSAPAYAAELSNNIVRVGILTDMSGSYSDISGPGAVEAAGTDDPTAVMVKMREAPVRDTFAENGKIRADGRMVHDMYVMQVEVSARIQVPVGLLQDHKDHSRRRSFPAARRKRMSVCEVNPTGKDDPEGRQCWD